MGYTCEEKLDYFDDRLYGATDRYETFGSSDSEDVVLLEEEEEVEEAPAVVCAGLRAVVEAADTLNEMMAAMMAHKAVCEVCFCDRKDVQSDRMYLGTRDAVCCEMPGVA